MPQLTLSVVAAAASHDISALGNTDWVIYPNSTTPVRKSGGGSSITVGFQGTGVTSSPYNEVGGRDVSWSGGTPTATGSSRGGVYGLDGSTLSAGKGYKFTVPADTKSRTLRVFCGGFNARPIITATLSDGSATTPAVEHSAQGYADATITFQAGSAGQTLEVTVTRGATTNAASCNVSISGAALHEAADVVVVPDAPTSVTATAGTNSASVTGTAPADNGGGAITGYRATSSPGGVTGTSATLPVTVSGLTAGQAYTFTLAAQNTAGYGAESTPSNSITPTAAPQPVQVGRNDPAVFWSPYNWDDYGAYKQSNNTGAYAKLNFTGASVAVNLDVSNLSGLSAGNYPIIRTVIDGHVFADTQLASGMTSITRSGLSAGSHTLEVYYVAPPGGSPDRWTGSPIISAIRLTGFTLGAGASASAPALRGKRMAYYGDSITEGYLATGVNSPGTVSSHSSQLTALPHIAAALGAEYGAVAYGGQGYAQGGGGNVPALNSAWNLFSAGRSRLVGGLFDPQPDYVFVEHGANGSTPQANVQTTISNLRAAAPNARIFIMVPAGGFGRSAITAAVAASGDAKVHVIDLGTSYEPGINNSGGNNLWAVDGLHRNYLSNARVAAGYTAKIQAAIDGAAQPMLNTRTVTLTLGNESGALANLTGLKVSFYDEPTPDLHTAPRFKTANETTDANGVMTFTVQSTLAPGGSGNVVVLMADGRNLVRTVTVA